MEQKIYYQNLQKNNISLSKEQSRILDILAKLDENVINYHLTNNFLFKITKPKDLPKGIYLHGHVGTGKSMLADLFYDNLEFEKKHKVHFHAFMLEIHAYLHKLGLSKDDLLKQAATYIAKRYKVLYIDELEISDIADAMIVGKLFRELFKQKVIIIITSNFAPEQLYLEGLQRDSFIPFINLIKEELDIVYIKDKLDYRKSKLDLLENTYYIYNEEMDSQRFILDSFSKLTNNAQPKNKLIQLDKTRELICPITFMHIAVFSFDQLCRSPMASSDYMAICQEFDIIILSSVPKLTAEEHNEARRFINLIDMIYNFHKFLICSATTEIDHIYQSGKWHFEFNRTVSRLYEMQSEKYWSKSLKSDEC
jgi:cell division protein ZapE